jgi:hypothetical protein
MAKELDITPQMNLAARIYQTRLRYQAPVATGKLRDSVKVRVVSTSDGFQLVTTFETYGIFTDSGTKRYYRPSDTATWRPRPGKGKGGIKPRYWTNVQDEATVRRVTNIIVKEVTKQIQQTFRKK